MVNFGVLDELATSDVDGDGTVQAKRIELTGVVGKDVTVTLDHSGAACAVALLVPSVSLRLTSADSETF